jgi:hypothetical protein
MARAPLLPHSGKTGAKDRRESEPMNKPLPSRRPPIRSARRGRCKLGRHLADPAQQVDERGLLRSRCRLCGAELVQLFGRAWIVSGKLG